MIILHNYDVSITMYRIIDDVDEYSLRMICVDLLDRQCDVQVRRCYNTHSDIDKWAIGGGNYSVTWHTFPITTTE